MKSLPALAISLCAVACLYGAPLSAGPLDDDFGQGLSAFNRGDYATAMRVWLPLVQSDPRSATGIGFMYHRGLGVAVDDEKAAAWMRGAAEHGQAEGQLMLGSFYFYGQGVPQSYVRAYAWCALGEINGQSDATLCREAALQLMSNSEREQAFRMVVDLRERYELRR